MHLFTFCDIPPFFAATPRPPLSFRVGIEDGEVTVQWKERKVWMYAAFIDRLYTVMYYPVSGKFVVSNEVCTVVSLRLIFSDTCTSRKAFTVL